VFGDRCVPGPQAFGEFLQATEFFFAPQAPKNLNNDHFWAPSMVLGCPWAGFGHRTPAKGVLVYHIVVHTPPTGAAKGAEFVLVLISAPPPPPGVW
jgi:hypothetical protein